jgi:hypothetical protein
MSFLSRLFGSKEKSKEKNEGPPPARTGGLTQRLERLEQEAQNAAPGYVGTSFNRAGDLALKEGDAERAMTYYGRAIDAFLEDEQPEAARGVANKIIRLRPRAVRTLCTLMWLDLAAKHTATAMLHLRDYVDAAKNAKQIALAAGQIFEMASVVTEREILGAIADALDSLDFSDRAIQVREWESQGGSPTAIADVEELAAACMKAATRSNQKPHAAGANGATRI